MCIDDLPIDLDPRAPMPWKHTDAIHDEHYGSCANKNTWLMDSL